MKIKLLWLLLLVYTAKLSTAQITITNSNMPSSSDTIRYSNTSFAGLNYDTTGVNITWDFSSATSLNQGLYEYKSSLVINPVYSLYFGLSSYGLKILDSLSLGAFTINNMYDFYKNNSSSFRAVGRGLEYGGFPIPADYSDDDEIYQFPLDYTDYDSSTYSVAFTLSTLLSLSQSGYRINEVDGYGTVITPYGTFSCLRVKTTKFETDSISINGIALPPFSFTTRQYKWLSTAEKIPVFELNGNVLFGNFVPTYARYRDNYIITNLHEPTTQSNMVLYPNPANNELTVSGLTFKENNEIIIADVLGKTVYQTKITRPTSDIKLAILNFPCGIYFLQLQQGDNLYTTKFIKE